MATKNHGGSRKGAGRKKSSGVSSIIKKHVDAFMVDMLKDARIEGYVNSDLRQLSISSGWIYVIRDRSTDYIKVGVTQRKNPNERLSLYASHNMIIDLVFVDFVDDCFGVEDAIHSQIEQYRVKGDWFKLDDENVLGSIMIISKLKHNKIYNGRW